VSRAATGSYLIDVVAQSHETAATILASNQRES